MADTNNTQVPTQPQAEPGRNIGMADWGFQVPQGLETRQTMQQSGGVLPSVSDEGLSLVPIESFETGPKKQRTVLEQMIQADEDLARKSATTPKTGYLRSEFIGDPERYPEMRAGEDNQTLEDRAFASQGTGERAVKSVANMVNGFTKTIVEGVTAPLVGLGYMIGEGRGSAFFDNPYNKALEKWTGFDIHESSKRKAAAWYSPDYWMSMNTLNSTLSTIGDLAGFAVLGGFAEASAGRLMGALGRGLESTIGGGAEFERSLQAIADMEAPLPKIGENLMGADYNKAIQGTADIVAGIPEGEVGEAAKKEFIEGLNAIKSSAMDAAAKKTAQEKLITDISKKYISKQEGFTLRNFDKVHRATVGIVTNLGMAQSSAYQASTNFREKMIEQIKSQGRIPTKQELDRIDDMAGRVGGVTGALMTVMGAVTLHGAWNGLLAKKEGEQFVRNGINEVIEGEAAEVTGLGKVSQITKKEAGVVEGKVNAEYEAKKSAIEARRTEELAKADPATHEEINTKYNEELKNIEALNVPVETPRTISGTVKAMGKTVWKNAAFAPGFGFLEFGLAPASVQSYYEKKYETKKDDFFSEMGMIADALGSNIKGMATKEGITSFILGTVTGSLMHVATGAAGFEKIQAAQRDANTDEAINAYNNTYLRSVTKAFVDSARRTAPLRKDYLDAIRSGDKEAEMTLRQQQVENYLFPRIKFGLKSFVDKDIATEKKMAATDEGIKELQSLGILPAEGNIADLRKGYLEHLNNIQEYANNAEQYYKALTLKYGAVLNPDGTRRYKDEHIEKLMFLSGGIDDITKRSKQLFEEIKNSEIGTDPGIIKRFSDLLRKYEAYQDEDVKRSQGRIDKAETEKLFGEINKLAMNPDKKEDIAKKFGDMLKLKVRQRQYLNEYNKIVSSPEVYADTIKETVLDPTDQGNKISGNYVKEVPVANKSGKMDLKIGETYFAGSKIVPGVGPDGKQQAFRSFAKFKIVGEKTVGEGEEAKRMITIRTDEGEQDIPEEVFSRYKLGAESTLNRPENRNAKYFFDNINTKYEYNYGKKGGGKIEGRLEYDVDQDQFYFVPDENTGKKTIPIEKADFRRQAIIDKKTGKPLRRRPDTDENGNLVEGEIIYYDEARIKAIGKIDKASQEWLDAKETEKETARREEAILNRMIAVDTILEKKKKLLAEAKDNLLENQMKLEDAKEALAKAEAGVKTVTGKDKSGEYKKRHWLGTSVGTIRELTKVVRETQSDIDKIQEQVNNLEEQIDYFEKYDVEGLPSGVKLLNFIDDVRADLMIAKEDAQNKINSLGKFIFETKETIRKATDRLKSYLDTFNIKYPEYKIDTDKLDEFAKVLDSDIDFAKLIVGEEGNQYLSDLQDMRKQLMEVEEMDINIRKSDMEKAAAEIEDLSKQITDIDKDLKLQDELYDAFKKKWDEFMKEKVRRELFNSPAYRERFAAIQGKLNNREDARGINNNEPQGWQNKVKEAWSSAKKSVWTVFRSSVLPFHSSRPKDGWPKDSFPAQYNNWADRFNEFVTNRNLGFPRPVDSEDRYIPVGEKGQIILVTRNNQGVLGFSSEFIPESYTEAGETIDNSTNAEKGTIAYVHVYYDEKEGKPYFIDKNGKLLGEVGTENAVSPDDAVFSFMETASKQRNKDTSAGIEKYHQDDATAEQEDALVAEALAMRNKILSLKGLENVTYFDYSESRGITNEEKGNPQKNSVAETKLGDNDSLKGTIKVSTLASEGREVAPVSTGETVLNFPVGYPIFVSNGNVAFLNGQRFGEAPGRVDHLFKVIKAMAEHYYKAATGEIDPAYTDYLSSVLYFSNKVDKETGIANNQLYFYDDPTLGKVIGFRTGDDKKPTLIQFTPEEISDAETVLKSWLANAFHSVSTHALKESEKGDKYNEIVDIDEKGEPVIKTWNSYEEYLLSDKDGRKNVPMTVNIKVPEQHEGPLVNKYIIPNFNGELFSLTKPAKEEKAEIVKEEETKEVKTEAETKLPPSGTTSFIIDGKTYKVDYGTTSEGGKPEIDFVKIYDESGKQLTPFIKDAPAIIKNISSQILSGVSEKVLAKEPVTKEVIKETSVLSSVPKKGEQNIVIDGKSYTVEYDSSGTGDALQVTINSLKDESGKNLTKIHNIPIYTKVGKELSELIKGQKKVETVEEEKPGTVLSITPPTAADPEIKPEAAPESKAGELKPVVVTVPEKNTSLASRLAAKAKANKAGESLMEVVPSVEERPASETDRLKEKEFIESTLPKIKYEELPHVIKTGNGVHAYGKYEKHLIQIWKDAPKGAGYHEHYHAVEDGFLTDKELDELRAEFKARKGSFVDRFGRTIKFSEATEYDRRERMAEEWREFKNNNPEFTKPSKVTNFFRRVANFIKEFVFGKKLTNDEFFKRMNASYYRDSKMIVRTSDEPVLMGIDGLTEIEKRAVVHGITWKIVDNLRNTTGGLIKVGEGTIIADMFDPVYKWMSDKYTDPDANGNIFSIRNAQIEQILSPEQNKKVETAGAFEIEDIIKVSNADAKQQELLRDADNKMQATFETWNKVSKEDGTGFRPEVVSALKDFFKKYKIVFDKKMSKKAAMKAIQDALAEDGIIQEETHHSENQETAEYHVEDVKDRGYDVEYMRVDAIGNAPIEVRLLFSFAPQPKPGYNPNLNKRFGQQLDTNIPSDLSHMQLPILVDSRKLMIKVLNGLAGTTSKKEMQLKMFEMAKNDPSLAKIYNAVYKDWSSCSLDDVRLRISFSKWASKMKPQYLAMRIGDDGRTYMINSNVDTDAKLIRSEWFSNIRNSPELAHVDVNQNAYMLKKSGIKDVDSTNNTSVVNFLKSIHLPVTNELFSKLSTKDANDLKQAVGEVHSLLKKGTYLTRESFEMEGPMNKLTNLLAKAEHLRMPSTHRNLDGNSVSNHIMLNGINRLVQSMIESGSIENLKKLQPRLFADTWSKNSHWLELGGPIFNEKGIVRTEVKEDERFAMTIAEGLINENTDNSPTKGMNRGSRFMNTINMILGKNGSGIFYNFIPADSSSETGLRAPHFVSKAELQSGAYKEKVEKRVIQYLKDEIDLIDENKNGKRIVTKNAKKHGDNLQVFKSILKGAKTKTDSTDLLNIVTEFAKNKNGKTTDDFMKEVVNGKTIEQRVIEAFWKNREEITDKQYEFLKDRKFLQLAGDKKYRWLNINSEFTEDLKLDENGLIQVEGDEIPKEDKAKYVDLKNQQVKSILRYIDMNLFVHNTENRKMFYGPWYETPDQTKRDKLYQSGTESTFVSDDFNTWYRNTQNNIGGVKIQDGEFGYHNVSNTMQQLTFNHDKGIRSRNYEQIRERLVKKFGEKVGNALADKYKQIEEMDAQGIVKSTSWKQYVLRSGDQWTDEDEAQDQYDNAMAILADANGRNGRTEKKTLRPELKKACEDIVAKGDPSTWGTGQPKKPLGVGMVKNDSQNIPFSNKTSIMRLSYTVAQGRHLEDLFWFLHDHNIDYAGPESSEKMGKLQDLPSLYKTENGKTEFNLSNLSEGEVKRVRKSIGWEDFNKIVETSKSKTGKTKGSQLESVIITNALEHELPIDFYNSDKDDYDTKKAEWDALSEEKKKSISKRYALYQDHIRAIGELSTRGMQKVLINLGIKEVLDKNGEVVDYDFVSPQKVVDFLKDEVTKRDLPENISEALNWVHNSETGKDELLYDLHTLPNYQQLTNIIWSHVQNNVISSKMNGTDNILVSAALFEKKGMRETFTKDGKSVISSSVLKFYEPGDIDPKTGKARSTSMMEVYAPNHLRKALEKWAERTGKELPSDKELFDYLNNTEEGQKLLTCVGFRTPTQGKNSIDAIRIVPFDADKNQMFLPASMGDSVVVPSELVAKAGIDFDVDKMGTYHFNFEIDEKGFPRYIEFIEDTKTDAGLEKLWEQKKKQHSDLRSEIENKMLETASMSIKELDEDVYNATKELEDLDKFIEKYRNADPWKVNSEKAIQNKYFETIQETTLLPDNYEELITPNSSDELIAIKDRISNLQEGGKGDEDRSKAEVDYNNLTDALWMVNQRQDYLDAKGNSVGIVATGNTAHGQSQGKLAIVTDNGRATFYERQFLGDFKIYLPHRQLMTKGEMVTTFSGIKNSVGTFISDFISQLINGAVDVVIDKWLIEIIGNKDTLGTCVFLGRCGVDPKYVFTFINQPVIQEYIKQSEIKKTLKGIDPQVDIRKRSDIIAEVYKATYKDLTVKEETRNRGDLPEDERMFKIADLEDMLRKSGQGKKMSEMNEGEREMQRQIFNEFLKYQTFANNGALREQLGNSINNMKGATDETIMLKEERNAVAKQRGLIGTSSSMFDDPKNFQSVILKNIVAMKKAIRKILPLSAAPVLEKMRKVFFNMDIMLPDDKRIQIANKMMSSYIDFGVQLFAERNYKPLNASITELLLDHGTNTAKMLSDFRRDPNIKGDVKDLITKALDRLSVKISSNIDGVKNVNVISKPNTAMESDMMTEAFRELRDNPHTSDLYSRLVYTALLQSGVRDGRASYAKYIPHEDWVQYIKPVIDMLKEDNGMIGKAFEESMTFYRNNYRDSDIVPRMNKIQGFFGANFPFFHNTNVDNQLNTLMTQFENQGFSKPGLMKVTDGYPHSRYPVIKTTEVITKPDGKPYTKYEKAEMAKKGDFSFTRTKLYQKVLNENGEPFVIGVTKVGDPVLLYKEINPWGDGFGLQEHYAEGRPSVLNRGYKVPELSDEWLRNAIDVASKDKQSKPAGLSEAFAKMKQSKESTTPVVEKGTTTEEGKKPNSEPGDKPEKACP